MAADRQQAESQLHHLRGTRAVDDSVEITLPRGLAELLRNLCRRLVLDADNVIGPVFLGDGEIVGIAVESDDRRAAAKELSVLDGIAAQSTDPENPENSIGDERAGIAELLEAAIGGQTRIGERCEFLEFQPTVDLDQIASGDWYELREAANGSKPRP